MATGYARVNFGISGIAAQPAAGANSGTVRVATPDDSQARLLTGVMITDVTKGAHTQVFNGQKLVADIGHDVFATTNRFLLFDEPFAPGISFAFITFNDSAGAMSANVGVTFRYLTGEGPPSAILEHGN